MNKLGTITTSGTASQLSLDPHREYTIINLDTTDDIYLAVGQAGVPDGGDGEGKYLLKAKTWVTFGPGVNVLSYAAAANTPKFGYSSEKAEDYEIERE